jgi:hypothetical protein
MSGGRRGGGKWYVRWHPKGIWYISARAYAAMGRPEAIEIDIRERWVDLMPASRITHWPVKVERRGLGGYFTSAEMEASCKVERSGGPVTFRAEVKDRIVRVYLP